MFNKLTRSTIVLILISIIISCYAKADSPQDDENLPSGMTLKKVGGANVIVPQGTRIRREADIRIVEGTGEYAARKFVEIDSHLSKIDSEIFLLRKENEEMKKNLSELQRSPELLRSK